MHSSHTMYWERKKTKKNKRNSENVAQMIRCDVKWMLKPTRHRGRRVEKKITSTSSFTLHSRTLCEVEEKKKKRYISLTTWVPMQCNRMQWEIVLLWAESFFYLATSCEHISMWSYVSLSFSLTFFSPRGSAKQAHNETHEKTHKVNSVHHISTVSAVSSVSAPAEEEKQSDKKRNKRYCVIFVGK